MTAETERQALLTRLFRSPVWGAPMAGGPSSVELAATLAAEGATALLAGGMRACQQLIEDYRAASTGAESALAAAGSEIAPGVIGVNLFVPEPANTAIPEQRRAADSEERRERAAAVAAYRETLLSDAEAAEVELPAATDLNPDDTDGWDEKLDAAVAERWPLVTFTFGLPAPEVFDRLREAGILTGVTVTSPAEAAAAVRHGADLLTLQGPNAGGHRSVHDPQADPGQTPLLDLLAEVRFVVGPDVPLIAAGGIMNSGQVAESLKLGAAAVQCGTAFLRAPEAGTNPTHRLALEQASARMNLTRTSLTRAYSGRWARGIENRFQRDHRDAPAAYPEINQLTAPLRAAAQRRDDVEAISLWAGVGVAKAEAKPATEILRKLTENLISE
ncbi:NAD(P)H-dependent flavin oxidoreductase [Citricoccus sp. NR2]|uniref:NAD(P)H-dependent flavin oxidoreductase n=1 Tax=Citricoccus sp. NR2 TaxID=3004095 RepID=UPI0022DE25CF|nr:nitronate monooxygenase [Citricoccus sp. NR2]WBL20050.1 nitronate monooxygenase [Citricoccus sp. NR2]